MVLRPEQARSLADVLLSGESESGNEPRGPDSGVMVDGTAPGPQNIGRYRVTRLIGHGGMGAVYEAQQEHPQRRVALKIVRAELVSPELARRLDHEARVLGRLEHPGIARIYEAGSWQPPVGGPSSPYFAMEYVEGKPLTNYVKDYKLSLKDRLELFLAVCEAVEHAHRRGVIHRDLKPGNILVDAEGKPRVLDFGLARATDADVRATTIHTEVGKLVGTLPYMSPEQVSGDPDATDTRSDVYSLGVVLYEMLAGKPPYQVGRGAIAEAARIIRDTEPTPLSSIDRVFRGDLEVIAGKALSKEKDRRYQSVSDLAGDVRRYLRQEPITARPLGVWYQMGKLMARHRLSVALGLSVVIILCLLTALSVTYAVREARARSLATKAAHEADQRAAKAAAIVSFLQQVLASPHPERAGQDIRVVDVLDTAEKDIEAQLVDQPDVAAAVLTAIGLSDLGLGELTSAERCFSGAMSRWHALGEEELPDALDTRYYLAQCIARQGRIVEAEPLMVEGLRLTRQVFGPEHPNTCAALNDLSLVYLELGRFDSAETTSREALAAQRRVFGDQHPETLKGVDNLGAILDARGKLEESLRLREDVHQNLLDTVGPDHPVRLSALSNLGATLQRKGEAVRAEPMLREAIERRERLLGPTHPDTLTSKHNLGLALRDQQQFEEAEALFRAVIESDGWDQPNTLRSMDALASVMEARLRFDQAEAMLRRVLAARVRFLGEVHPDTVRSHKSIGSLLRRMDRVEEAANSFASAARGAAIAFGVDDERTARINIRFGEALSHLRRFDEAERALLEAANHLPASGRDHTECVGLLIALYEASGRPAEAAEWRERQRVEARDAAPAVDVPAPLRPDDG